MKQETITIETINKTKIKGILWIPDGQIKAVLQIAHGMTEHIQRYEDFANYCTLHGILCAGFDLRGHGIFAKNNCASFGENGWDAVLSDMHHFHNKLKELYPDVPHFMYGFSLGSFLLREYLNQAHDSVDGAIISGTGQQSSLILTPLMAIVKTQIKQDGFDNTTPLIDKLSFETYNQKFKPNRTGSDWLCSDSTQLDQYIQDPLCCKHISSGLFYQLLNSMKTTGNAHAYDHWDKNMPVLILSGTKDPVGDFTKGVEQFIKAMKKSGCKNIESHFLSEARHDVLHEKENGCAKQAQELIVQWIKSHI